jgi:hypothetical protein
MRRIEQYCFWFLIIGKLAVGFLPPLPTCSNRLANALFAVAKNVSVPQPQPRPRRRVNTNVRSIMELIETRYGTDGKDWTKTKRYMYHASDKLSLEQVQEVVDFLDSLVSKQASKQIIQTAPRILRKPVDSFLKPTADFLLDLWGPSLFEEAMKRKPQLLLTSGVGYTNSNPKGDGDTEEILSELAGFSYQSLKQLKRTSPFVFGLPPTKVRSVLEYLTNILQYGKNLVPDRIPKVLGKLVVAHPYLLNLGVETNLKPRVEFLSTSCGLNVTDVAKLVQSSGGSVLGLSVNENLKPTMAFLSVLLQNDRSFLRKCILAHPQLLGLSLSNLDSKVEYFSGIGKSLAFRIALRCPAVYSLSLTGNLIPTIEFLAKVWGTPSDDDETCIIEPDCVSLAHFLQEYPNVLTLSVEGNIQPTMNFFNRTGYTALNEEWELVSGQNRIRGRYIAASLYNRLLPRWHYCLSQELTSPPLHMLVTSSDHAFCNEQGLDLDEFVRFRDDAIPRLKFSSQFDTWLKTGRPIDL